MSVRVNLLPEASRQKTRLAKQRRRIGAGVLAVVAGLAGVHLWTLAVVGQARAERDAAQIEVAARQAEIAEMAPYAELVREHAEAETTLSTALAGEISLAGVLQDLALVLPDDVALTSMEIARIGEATEGSVVVPAAARLTIGGEALRGAAPGVEQLLWDLGRLSAVTDPYVSSLSAIEDEPDAVTFTVEADLTDEVYTQRYVTGLPENLR